MLQTTFLACQLVRRVNLAPLLVEMLVCLNKVKSHDLCCVQLVRTLSSPSNIVLCRLISSANYMCKPISWPAQELFESCNSIPVQITSSYDWSYWITGIVMPCYQLPSALTPFSPSPRSPYLWPLRLPTSPSPPPPPLHPPSTSLSPLLSPPRRPPRRQRCLPPALVPQSRSTTPPAATPTPTLPTTTPTTATAWSLRQVGVSEWVWCVSGWCVRVCLWRSRGVCRGWLSQRLHKEFQLN